MSLKQLLKMDLVCSMRRVHEKVMDPSRKFEVYFCLIVRLVLKHPFFCFVLAHSRRSFDVFCWCDSSTRAWLSRSPLHYNERSKARIKLTTDIIDVRVCVITGLICSL